MFSCLFKCLFIAYFALHQDLNALITSLQLVDYWTWAWVNCVFMKPYLLFVIAYAYFLLISLFVHFFHTHTFVTKQLITEANSDELFLTKLLISS